MFHPAANRLAGFLEISALSLYLSHSGGSQFKAGYLQIESVDKSGFGRKGTGWRAKRESRWCAVRESYLVVLEEPGEVRILSDTPLLTNRYSSSQCGTCSC